MACKWGVLQCQMDPMTVDGTGYKAISQHGSGGGAKGLERQEVTGSRLERAHWQKGEK